MRAIAASLVVHAVMLLALGSWPSPPATPSSEQTPWIELTTWVDEPRPVEGAESASSTAKPRSVESPRPDSPSRARSSSDARREPAFTAPRRNERSSRGGGAGAVDRAGADTVDDAAERRPSSEPSRWLGMRGARAVDDPLAPDRGVRAPGSEGGPRLPSPAEIDRAMQAELAKQWAAEHPARPGLPLGPVADEPAGPPLLTPDGGGGYRHERQTFVARVDRDGTVRFRDKPNLQADGVELGEGGLPLGWRASFDLTDAAMRARGEDPYRYEKAKFLDATREARAEMAATDRRERLREAIHDLAPFLAAIWAHSAWSFEQRRRAVFLAWDDCAEIGDDELVRAAAEARATIIAFVRRELPAGSSHAYTADELRRLNAERRSTARFDPYDREDRLE